MGAAPPSTVRAPLLRTFKSETARPAGQGRCLTPEKDSRLLGLQRENSIPWNSIYKSRQLTIQLLNCQIFHVIRAYLSN